MRKLSRMPLRLGDLVHLCSYLYMVKRFTLSHKFSVRVSLSLIILLPQVVESIISAIYCSYFLSVPSHLLFDEICSRIFSAFTVTYVFSILVDSAWSHSDEIKVVSLTNFVWISTKVARFSVTQSWAWTDSFLDLVVYCLLVFAPSAY